MANCPHCGAEVDVGQKMCAWCGEDLPANLQETPAKPAPAAPQPQPRQEPPAAHPARSRQVHTIEEARLHAKAGRLDEAEHVFHVLLEEDASSQEALFGLGGIFFTRGETKKAAEAWVRLKKINPDYPHIDQWIAQIQQKAAIKPAASQPAPSHSAPRPQPRPEPPPPVIRTRSHRAPASATAPSPSQGEEDDWTRQAVRVSVDQSRLDEDIEAPIEKPVKQRDAAPAVEKPKPVINDNRNSAFAHLLSWMLFLAYAGLFVFVYFLL